MVKTFNIFMMRKKKKSKSFGPTYCFRSDIISPLRGQGSLWRPGENSTGQTKTHRAVSATYKIAEELESASGRNKPLKSDGFQNRQVVLFAWPNGHNLPKITPRFCKRLNKLTRLPLSAHFCFVSESIMIGQPY